MSFADNKHKQPAIDSAGGFDMDGHNAGKDDDIISLPISMNEEFDDAGSAPSRPFSSGFSEESIADLLF
jgi:hypothetical protein